MSILLSYLIGFGYAAGFVAVVYAMAWIIEEFSRHYLGRLDD